MKIKNRKIVSGIGLAFALFIFLDFSLPERAWSNEEISYASLSVPAGENLRFFAIGDHGTGRTVQYQVAAAMEERCRKGEIDGLLLLGDNFYPSGVKSVKDPQWEKKMVRPYDKECLAKAPIYAILGNHDHRGNTAAQIKYSQMNPRWTMPALFYTVDFGKLLRLVAVDTPSGKKSSEFMGNFLNKTLETNKAAWKIVLGHHPIASASTLDYDHAGGARRHTWKSFICHKADAWLAGHAHHLEHRELPGCSVSLYVSGRGGGNPQRMDKNDPESKFAASTDGFLELEISLKTLTTRFIDAQGRLLYETSRVKEK